MALCTLQGLGAAPAARAAAPGKVSFKVTGSAAGLLYPDGPAQGIPLTLENPMNQTIYITRVSAGVRDTGSSGCNANWFQTTGLTVPRGGIAIPPKESVQLGRAGLGEPTIRMRESGTNQDACRGTELELTYAGATHPAAANQATSAPGSGDGGAGGLPFTGLLLVPLAAIGALLGLAGLVMRSGQRRVRMRRKRPPHRVPR
jgi:hypothetical protein